MKIVVTAPLSTSIESLCWLKDYGVLTDTLCASDKLKILQINIHHCKQANEALDDYVLNEGVDEILGQDPYVLSGVVVFIPPD